MAEKSKQSKAPPPVERVMKDVPAPIATLLDSNVLFNRKSPNDPVTSVNTAALQSHLLQEGKLAKEDVMFIVERVTELFAQEPNVLSISAPLTVCGDVHGQYYDLVKLLEVGGNPSETTYLFLGDYVDRGSFSVEVVLLLYAFKINFPSTFLMIRGNHECRHLTQYFTFRTECIRKYSIEVYDAIMDSFDALPLAALMNNQFLCVHGGISPQIHSIDDISAIDRFCEPPQSGPMCDLLWADPMEEFNPETQELFAPNDVRGCSFLFSYRAVCQFLDRNGLLSIIRAHEAQDQGYRMHLTNEATGFPSVITLFSAPNYLDAYNNKGAVLRYENNVMNIRQFNHSPHPYWLPNFMNVITWSLPFVAEKVSEMLLTVLNLIDAEVDEAAEEGDEAARLRAEEAQREKAKRERLDRLKNKVKGVSKMLKMYSLLTSERETILQLKAFTPENKIPPGLLTSGVDAIRDALGNFEKSKSLDRVNEMRPASPAGQMPSGPNKKLHAIRTGSSDRLLSLVK